MTSGFVPVLFVALSHVYYPFRNHIPWIIIGVCYAACISLNLTIRWYLSTENKRRDREPPDHTYDHVYLEKMNNGMLEKVKVDKACQVLP